MNSDRKKSAHLVATERGRKIWRRLLPVNEGELNYEALVLGGRWHIPRHVHPFSVPHQPRYSPGYSGFPPRYAGTEVGEKIFLNAEQVEIPSPQLTPFLFFFFLGFEEPRISSYAMFTTRSKCLELESFQTDFVSQGKNKAKGIVGSSKPNCL